jgi:hypothetical protein
MQAAQECRCPSMIGGIMPKLSTMGPLIAAALLSLGVLGVIVGWAAPSGGGGVFGNFTWLDQDDVGRRQRELLFSEGRL